MLMRPRPGNVPSCSSILTVTTGTVVTIVTLPDITLQLGEYPDKQLAHGGQAGANDGDVVFDHRPDGYGVVVPGYVGRRLKGEERAETDDGDYCFAGRMSERVMAWVRVMGRNLQDSDTQHKTNGQLLLPIHVEFPELGQRDGHNPEVEDDGDDGLCPC